MRGHWVLFPVSRFQTSIWGVCCLGHWSAKTWILNFNFYNSVRLHLNPYIIIIENAIEGQHSKITSFAFVFHPKATIYSILLTQRQRIPLADNNKIGPISLFFSRRAIWILSSFVQWSKRLRKEVEEMQRKIGRKVAKHCRTDLKTRKGKMQRLAKAKMSNDHS